MFKIDECFKSSGIFNELLTKRFDENFKPQSGSRLWMTPGHIVFTSDGFKVYTCDARPYDFSTSPSEPESDEFLVAVASVLEIFFDTETSSSTRMFIALENGDVQIFEYRIMLYEWARIGYFNVNIVSPNSNNNHNIVLDKILISRNQNMIFWSEKMANPDTSYNLQKREIPLNSIREITQSAIGVPQKLLKNCPHFDLLEIRDNICILPQLPNLVNVYIIISARSHIWFFNINGKCLWRDIISDSPIDVVTLCAKTIGLWSQGGSLKVCTLLNHIKNYAYVLYNSQLLAINATGDINKKIDLNLPINDIHESFVMHNALYTFMKQLTILYIHDIQRGQLIQQFDLSNYAPITGICRHSSNIPSIGFYSNNMIHKLSYMSLNSILTSDPCHLPFALNVLRDENFHIFALLKDLVHEKFANSNIPALQNRPLSIQSEALLLAMMQSCREQDFKSKDFPLKHSEMQKLFSEDVTISSNTKLKQLLNPLVECFVKLEKSKVSLIENCN